MQVTILQVAVILAAVGAINWGLIALTSKPGKQSLNLVDKVFKPAVPMSWKPSQIGNIVYILVGIAGVIVLSSQLQAMKGTVQNQWM